VRFRAGKATVLLEVARVRTAGQTAFRATGAFGILPLLRGAREGHGVRVRSSESDRLIYRVADAVRRHWLKDDLGRVGEDLAHRHLRRRPAARLWRGIPSRGRAGERSIYSFLFFN